MLTDLVHVTYATESTDPEDILASTVSAVFPHDTRSEHGAPGATVIYESSRFGDVRLLTADPEDWRARELFAHYLWNAGIWLAERISNAGVDDPWSVKDQTVLELGAGVGLVAIVSSLAGARRVAVTDYPAPDILQTLRRNTEANVTGDAKLSVEGHEWGRFGTVFAEREKGGFSRVIAADCLWMPWQHRNLVCSMLHFLSSHPSSTILLVAGFHTGRAKLAPFFDVAEEEGLEIVSIEEEDVEGHKRPWAMQRDDWTERISERKRWLVTAILRRQQYHAQPV